MYVTGPGVLTTEPYPMLRVAGDDGKPRNALLACSGKCGVANLISDKHGQTVRIRGSLIHRGDNAMIAVPETEIDWIETVDETPLPELAFPTPQPIGEVDLAGEILDSKCWFGRDAPVRRESPQGLRRVVYSWRHSAGFLRQRHIRSQRIDDHDVEWICAF